MTNAAVKCINQPFNDEIEAIYSRRIVYHRNGAEIPLNVYIPREEGELLYRLVREIKPQVSLEVGMANGLSTLFIAQALEDNRGGQHIAIDPFQHSEWGGAAMVGLERAGLSGRVELIEKPSHQALPELEQSGTKVQFAFVDGSHLFDYVLCDFLCIDRLLDSGGLIAFDDSDWPSITQVIRYAVKNRHYEVACPDIVIEDARYTPTLANRALRRVASALPSLESKLRSDFVEPTFDMGVRGRCVVLRKMANDDRDSQSKFHIPF